MCVSSLYDTVSQIFVVFNQESRYDAHFLSNFPFVLIVFSLKRPSPIKTSFFAGSMFIGNIAAKTYNLGQNIFRRFYVLAQVILITSKMELDYYHQI